MIAILAASATHRAQAHGGGLDRHGCHTQRSTGEYHCHRGAAPPAASVRQDSASGFAPSRSGYDAPQARDGAFADCSEARAAGAAPVRRGDPGYGPHLDRDGDGIGCEPRR